MPLLTALPDDKNMKIEFKFEHDSGREDSMDDEDPRLVIKEEPDSQSNFEHEANQSAASSCDYNMSQFSRNESDFEGISSTKNEMKTEPEESEEDIPLVSIFSLV